MPQAAVTTTTYAIKRQTKLNLNEKRRWLKATRQQTVYLTVKYLALNLAIALPWIGKKRPKALANFSWKM